MYFCSSIVSTAFEKGTQECDVREAAMNQTSNKAQSQGTKNSKLVSSCHVQYSSILETSNQLKSRSYFSTTYVWRH